MARLCGNVAKEGPKLEEGALWSLALTTRRSGSVCRVPRQQAFGRVVILPRSMDGKFELIPPEFVTFFYGVGNHEERRRIAERLQHRRGDESVAGISIIERYRYGVPRQSIFGVK